MNALQQQPIDDRFRLIDKLGSGAFGTVWLAEDLSDRSTVALKLLHADHQKKPWVLERFIREGAILARLLHPNIARAVAFAVREDAAYLALEHVEGRTLEAHIGAATERGELLPIAETLQILAGLAAALDAAHAEGVVHRDLKPRNVMIRSALGADRVKVLDFGVAKIINDPGTDATTVGRLLGSLLYLSPEQVKGSPVDGRADLFALATIAFELLTGRRAWTRGPDGRPLSSSTVPIMKDQDNNHVSILRRIAIEARPRVSALRPELGAAIDAVFERALAIEPGARFPTGAVLLDECRQALQPSLDGAEDTLVRPQELTGSHPGPGSDSVTAPPQRLAPATSPFAATPAAVAAERPRRRLRLAGFGLVALMGTLLFMALRIGATLERTEPGAPTEPAKARPWAVQGAPSAAAAASPAPAPELPPLETGPAPEPRKDKKAAPPPRRAESRPQPKKEHGVPPHASPSPAAAPSPTNPILVQLHQLLTQLKQNPAELSLANALGEQISRAAELLPEGDQRTSLKRRAANSVMDNDLAGLERCVKQLDAALPP